MSYILDALRKADADREGGAVPDLNAQPLAAAPGGFGLPESPPLPWGWLAAGVLLALAAIGGWQWLSAPGPAEPAPMAMPGPAAPVAVPGLATPAQVAAPQPAPMLPSPVTLPPQPQPNAPSPMVVAAPAADPARAGLPRKEARAAAGGASAPRKSASAVAAASAQAAASEPAASAASEKLPKLAELPDSVRREVPAMAIGGAVYSPQPDARMVIVNGQVAREGEAVGPGLMLVQIRPRSAVFSIRGQRFEVPL
jgi:general secretion pathway protein B